MRQRRHKSAFVALLLAIVGAPAHAAETLFGDAALTHFPGKQAAYAATLTLQEAVATGGLTFALSNTEFPIGSLAYADVGAYRILSPRFTVSGGATIGIATTDTSSSTLYKTRIALDTQLDSQWSVRVADQFVDLDALHGHLMNASTEYRPVPAWGFKIGGGYAVSGTLADRYGELAVNWYAKQHLFGGLVLGRTGYDIATLGKVTTVNRLFQAYLGASMPTRVGTYSIALDTLNLNSGDRQTLRIGFIQPITP